MTSRRPLFDRGICLAAWLPAIVGAACGGTGTAQPAPGGPPFLRDFSGRTAPSTGRRDRIDSREAPYAGRNATKSKATASLKLDVAAAVYRAVAVAAGARGLPVPAALLLHDDQGLPE